MNKINIKYLYVTAVGMAALMLFQIILLGQQTSALGIAAKLIEAKTQLSELNLTLLKPNPKQDQLLTANLNLTIQDIIRNNALAAPKRQAINDALNRWASEYQKTVEGLLDNQTTIAVARDLQNAYSEQNRTLTLLAESLSISNIESKPALELTKAMAMSNKNIAFKHLQDFERQLRRNEVVNAYSLQLVAKLRSDIDSVMAADLEMSNHTSHASIPTSYLLALRDFDSRLDNPTQLLLSESLITEPEYIALNILIIAGLLVLIGIKKTSLLKASYLHTTRETTTILEDCLTIVKNYENGALTKETTIHSDVSKNLARVIIGLTESHEQTAKEGSATQSELLETSAALSNIKEMQSGMASLLDKFSKKDSSEISVPNVSKILTDLERLTIAELEALQDLDLHSGQLEKSSKLIEQFLSNFQIHSNTTSDQIAEDYLAKISEELEALTAAANAISLIRTDLKKNFEMYNELSDELQTTSKDISTAFDRAAQEITTLAKSRETVVRKVITKIDTILGKTEVAS